MPNEPVWTREMIESASEELTLERLQGFREHYLNDSPEIPEWQRQVLQAMIEGRHVIVSRARQSGFRRLLDYLREIEVAGDAAEVTGSDYMPDDSVIAYDPEAMIPSVRTHPVGRWAPEQVEIPNLSGRLPSLNELANRLGIQATTDPDEIPDVTDEDRERWARAIDTAPTQQGSTPGAGLTIDELLGDIDLALTEYKEERE